MGKIKQYQMLMCLFEGFWSNQIGLNESEIYLYPLSSVIWVLQVDLDEWSC